jgi:uncharacterized delta-60 repeat protein
MDRQGFKGALATLSLFLVLAGCGGGDEADPPTSPTPPPPPPPGTVIGAAGGTVTGPGGVSVVIPAGALTTDTRILIEQATVGAPPLPAGFTLAGQMFSFTPHGTSFAVPVTITLPYSPATVPVGHAPQLFKTIANQTQWEAVPGAVFGTSTVTAQISSFSFGGVATSPFNVGRPHFQWKASLMRGNALVEEILEEGGQTEGALALLFDFGGILPWPGGISIPIDGVAVGDITASADGTAWAVGTEAPRGRDRTPVDALGSRVMFKQTQTFSKRTEDARLSVTFDEAFLEAVDGNLVLRTRCPPQFLRGLECDSIKAEFYVEVQAFTLDATPEVEFDTFFHVAGGATLSGIAGSWHSSARPAPFSREPLWSVEDFDFTIESLNGSEEALVRMELRRPRTFEVDLSRIPVGRAFMIQSYALVTAYDRAVPGSEFITGSRAFVRDPLRLDGARLTHSGLEALPTLLPVPEPTAGVLAPQSCGLGPGPLPEAGTIQFDAAGFTQLEGSRSPSIVITRTGGTAGAVTATLTSSNGTATAGTDYEPVSLTVFFNDGDAQSRDLALPLLDDQAHSEPDKSVILTLSQPGGCAGIGAQGTTLVTIQDDDVPPPPPEFRIRGTVSGLVGTGLRLEDQHRVPIAVGNGPFELTLGTQVGDPYEVTVVTQPTNPVQVCSVVNGTGTMGNADVTNVQVNCVTPAASGTLDPGFGGTGKVSPVFGGDETGMALQPDGKIVMVGGTGGTGSDFALARFNADGSPDAGFGTAGNGTITTDLAGGNDDARAVALQSDGKIVVVGLSRVGSSDDFAIVRYLPNGTVDTTFGTQGRITTDFGGGRDRALAVAVLPDDRIVVVGDAILPAPGNTDFALARYTANGAPDLTFDGDGKLTADIGGGVDIAQNVVLQGAQGAILVSGVLTLNGSPALEHAGIARFLADGALDASFGTAGRKTFADLAIGEGLALDAGGRILLAGHTRVGGDRVFAMQRLDPNGNLDGGFGTAGLATAALTTNDDFGRALAVHPDGRIFVAGQSSNQSNPDFGIACFGSGGTLDTAFDGDGKVAFDFFGGFDGAENIAVQADGLVVVSGFARNGNRTNYALARFAP